MVRQGIAKRATEPSDIEDDIKFLLSHIRARQSGLIFFTQIFSSGNRARLQGQQHRIYKQQFLQKQKIYSSQIKSLVDKLSNEHLQENQARSFWIKLKSIIRVTIERARQASLLTDSLKRKYDQLLLFIETAWSQAAQIREYLRLENMLKKRMIEALIVAKQVFMDNPTENVQTNKNRSQTFLKFSKKPSQSLNLSPHDEKIISSKQIDNVNNIGKLKSMTRVKKRGEKVALNANQHRIKRSIVAWHAYEKSIADVMGCKFQNIIDKKKTKQQNEEKIYDTLFEKNISNHKIIAKYSHSCSKLKAILVQMSRNQKQRIQHQKKLNTGARQISMDIIGQKSGPLRAKTSKKPKPPTQQLLPAERKAVKVRIQSGASHKAVVK